MAYIGKTPIVGNFQKCDAITVVNGQAAYTMQVGGSNVSPESENHMLVSLNGILQAPVDSFTISGSTITFASNLATGDVIDFIMLLGNVLDLGTPSDNTVSTAKIVDGAITSAKLASGVGGKILQVVSTTKTDTFTSTSTSFVDITGLSVAITPSATSSKILIMYSAFIGADDRGQIKLLRGSSDIFVGASDSANRTESSGFGYGGNSDDNAKLHANSGVFLDSPNTTSQTTYKLQAITNSGTVAINRSVLDNDQVYQPRTASSITVLEVSA